ncbi:hypothetical protein U1Q18_032547 [Sarracenia purpurea var. burkii]
MVLFNVLLVRNFGVRFAEVPISTVVMLTSCLILLLHEIWCLWSYSWSVLVWLNADFCSGGFSSGVAVGRAGFGVCGDDAWCTLPCRSLPHPIA